MKWILILFACTSMSFNAFASKNDLTQFDVPFLLGDWYLVNPNPDMSQENFLAIKLTFDSNYDFTIDIQKKDYTVDHWQGIYTADDSTIILGLNSDEPQVYEYSGSHNTLSLNGVTFTKALSNSLAGMWSSEQLTLAGSNEHDLDALDLVLQPDFVFMFRITNSSGEEAVHRGIYYTEGDHLVLLYEDGEHDTKYTLNRDKLTIDLEEGDMQVVLNRIK